MKDEILWYDGLQHLFTSIKQTDDAVELSYNSQLDVNYRKDEHINFNLKICENQFGTNIKQILYDNLLLICDFRLNISSHIKNVDTILDFFSKNDSTKNDYYMNYCDRVIDTVKYTFSSYYGYNSANGIDGIYELSFYLSSIEFLDNNNALNDYSIKDYRYFPTCFDNVNKDTFIYEKIQNKFTNTWCSRYDSLSLNTYFYDYRFHLSSKKYSLAISSIVCFNDYDSLTANVPDIFFSVETDKFKRKISNNNISNSSHKIEYTFNPIDLDENNLKELINLYQSTISYYIFNNINTAIPVSPVDILMDMVVTDRQIHIKKMFNKLLFNL